MDTKLTLTLYDILSHLLPGAALLFTLFHFQGLGSGIRDNLLLSYFVIFGYLGGVFLHLFGSILYWSFYPEDYVNSPWRYHFVKSLEKLISFPLMRAKRVDDLVKEELVKVIKNKLKLNLKNNRLGLFAFADTYVASLGYGERDILLAREALFRTLTATTVLVTTYFSFFNPIIHYIWILVIGISMVELCRYGREFNRVIKNQQIYNLALIKLTI